MRYSHTNTILLSLLAISLITVNASGSDIMVVSEATSDCLTCHASATPGIVANWYRGRHAETSPGRALHTPAPQRRFSAETAPAELADFVVGCAECHTLNAPTHGDTFEHNGYQVHTVVSPEDCAVCHPQERLEYADNLMAHACGNLNNNALYHTMMEAVNGTVSVDDDGALTHLPPGDATTAASCNYCHGTKIEVVGFETRENDFDDMTFPILTGWPNRGVGRINPDGSMGACTPCHARHQFSIEMARDPHTCAECHKGPDVPAYKVYSVSKHGNIFAALGKDWDREAVPWTLGRDFTAPTCAVCHISLVQDAEGETVATRTHRMNDRLSDRIFGLIYAHPHPKDANTAAIRNASGLPLPTELTGEPATEFLIDEDERQNRRSAMQNVCLSCHSTPWVMGHFEQLDTTIATTNQMTLAATQIMMQAWDEGLAHGPASDSSAFDETIERMWAEQWLFYANTVRFAAAMAGADYGVFENGRWHLSKNAQAMNDWLIMLRAAKR